MTFMPINLQTWSRLSGNQNELVPREDYDVDLHYAGTRTVPVLAILAHISY